ncbi:uncharacterized protein LOC132511446 [Lagenorhynchus albirostris]|uniref:uncharacterized protein LOC132511446 n=1 Tax=Lagenorhynchus albirostris TaxID=27610 RepID=UPI0028E27F3A|nr:uncharacterized protein LOC132511446 [Lagenorhynchus albirostris]
MCGVSRAPAALDPGTACPQFLQSPRRQQRPTLPGRAGSTADTCTRAPAPPASTPNPIPLWLAAPPPRATLTDWRPSLGPQPHPSRDTWGTLAQEAGHVGQFVCHWQGRGTLRDPPRPPKQIAPEAPCPPATADCGSLFLTRSRQVVTHVPFPLRTCCRWRLGQGWSPDGLHDVHFNKSWRQGKQGSERRRWRQDLGALPARPVPPPRKPSLGAPGPGGHRPGASGTQNTDDGEPPAWCLEPEDSWMGRVPLGPPGGACRVPIPKADHIQLWNGQDGAQGPLVFPARLQGRLGVSSSHTNKEPAF